MTSLQDHTLGTTYLFMSHSGWYSAWQQSQIVLWVVCTYICIQKLPESFTVSFLSLLCAVMLHLCSNRLQTPASSFRMQQKGGYWIFPPPVSPFQEVSMCQGLMGWKWAFPVSMDSWPTGHLLGGGPSRCFPSGHPFKSGWAWCSVTWTKVKFLFTLVNICLPAITTLQFIFLVCIGSLSVDPHVMIGHRIALEDAV